jgi:hypothetical protein
MKTRMRKVKTHSRAGRRAIRKTRRRLTRRKQRGGNIFFDSRKRPAGAIYAGPIGSDIDESVGLMAEYDTLPPLEAA